MEDKTNRKQFLVIEEGTGKGATIFKDFKNESAGPFSCWLTFLIVDNFKASSLHQ